MKTVNTDIILQNKIFFWLALATGVILSIPAIAMQFSNDVNWSLLDFGTMAILLFGIGSLYTLTARKVSKKYRAIVGLFFALALLYLWAELAVGIFTRWGS